MGAKVHFTIDGIALQSVVGRLYDALAGAGKIEMEAGYYWSIPSPARYDVSHFPAEGEAGIGQLSEDYQWLLRLLSDGQRDVTAADLVYLGRILQAMGEAGAALSP